MTAKQQVVILGGGLGGLSTAYWLSATPTLRARYEISLCTPGWRLGGKGASGRQPDARILEHGLHVMLGFYETTFRMLRGLYAALPPELGLAFPDWQSAFERQRQISLWLAPGQGGPGWTPWNLDFPRLPGEPGLAPLPTLAQLGGDLEAALGEALSRLRERVLPALAEQLADHPLAAAVHKALDGLAQRLTDLAGRVLHAIEQVAADLLVAALEALRAALRLLCGDWLGSDSPLRYQIAVLVDLALAGLIGLLRDVLPQGEAGYARIDHLDLKAWLQGHGADPRSVTSPLVMCLYDLAFAYVDGDSSKPENGQAAAGTMLKLILRMGFTYRDAPLWKMRAGMGDVIMTPLYKVLAARGVRFRFFHRATRLDLDAGGEAIGAIELQRQADTLGDYQPLRRQRFADGRGWDCWPAEPDWAQLVDGDKFAARGIDFEDPWQPQAVATEQLQRGRDFDLVVLALPPAAAAPLSAALRRQPAWAAMLDRSASVATLSAQLWLKPDLEGLGWPHGSTVAVCGINPFRSWGAMEQVLPAEGITPFGEPKSLAYLCGTYRPQPAPAPGSDAPGYVPAEDAAVAAQARQWLARGGAAPLWPAACEANGALNPALLDGFFARANVELSERYVQSLPGTVQYRLAPGASGYPNLFLAGDWTQTSINGGCAEAAVESGLRAACAISGEPPADGLD